MAIPERFPWLRAFWARMGMDEPANPLMWRDRFGRLMLAYGAIVLPLAMIYIVPVYIAERRYGLIAIDVAFWLFMICQLRVFRFPSRINSYLTLGVLYAITITFIVSLGPFQARPAWLVLCTLLAGVFFGVRGAIAAAFFDAAILMALYGLLGSEKKAWAPVYAESVGNWIKFVFNTSFLALGCGLTAGLLLNRLDRSLRDQLDAAETQLKHTEDLKKAYGLLQSEMTQRKVAEEALIQSEGRLKRAQEIAMLGSWELDLANNRLTWSDEVYRIYGLQSREFGATYEAFLEAVHPEDRAAVDAAYSGSVREGKDAYEIEHRVVKKSTGEVRIVHEKCEHVRDESGRIIMSSGMVHDITERKRAEEALRKAHDDLERRVQERTSLLDDLVQRLQAEIIQRKRLEETLRESEIQVRLFASQCLTAQETERRRIAAELHDSLAASLAATKFRIESISQGSGNPESMKDLASNIGGIINDVRRIMSDLRPSVLDDLGILAAVNWFSREYQKTYSHISVEKQLEIEEHDVPESIKTPIFRIYQEAMNNVAKHSRASHVNLSLQKEGERIVLTVQDNGQGFDPETVKKGMGLSSIRERAELSGGTSELQTGISKGTTIRVSWPIQMRSEV